MPRRIKLQRKKGWKMPPNTVKVARPTTWGNPYKIGEDGTRAEVIELFKRSLLTGKGRVSYSVGDVRRELAGFNLACWCKLDQGCHADVLLQIANS